MMARSVPQSFYKSRRWIKCRDSYMMKQNYICERCKGMASICHHKVYLNAENYKNPYVSLNHDFWSACVTHVTTKNILVVHQQEKDYNLMKKEIL